MCGEARHLLLLLSGLMIVDCRSSELEHKPVLYIVTIVEKCHNHADSDIFITGELAVELINNRSDVLPEYDLQLIKRNFKCEDPSGLITSLGTDILWDRNSSIVGIIGPTTVTSVMALGLLIGREQLALTNINMAVSTALEDRINYPNSFGVFGSPTILMHSVVQLIRLRNWSNVSILYDESLLYYSSALYDIDQTLYENSSIREYFTSSFRLTYIPLADIKKNESRIIFLFMSEDLVQRVLCLAYYNDMVFPAYQFIIVGNFDVASTNISFNHNHVYYYCSSSELAIALSGSVFVTYYFQSQHKDNSLLDYDFSLEYVAEKYKEKLHNLQPAFQQSPTVNSNILYYFDAFWSLSLALHRSNDRLQQNLSTSTFSTANSSASSFSTANGSTSAFSTDTVKKMLLSLDFNGFSGPINYDSLTGYVTRNVCIYQNLESRMVLLYIYKHQDKRMIDFNNSGKFLQSDIEVNVVIRRHPIPSMLSYLAIVITFIGLLFLLTMHILTMYYRTSKAVKASSPRILHLAFAGCYFLVICQSAYTCIVGFPDKIQDYVCCHLWFLVNVTLGVGLTMIKATLSVRTWRLYRIFVYFRNPGKLLADQILISVVLVYVLFDIFIATIWFIADPFEPKLSGMEREIKILHGSDGKIVDLQILLLKTTDCRVKFSFLFWYLIMFVFSSIFSSLILFILLFLTRNIPQKNFQTKSIIRLSYGMIVGPWMLLIIYMVLLIQYTMVSIVIRFIIATISLNCVNFSMCCFLFLPPIYSTIKDIRK